MVQAFQEAEQTVLECFARLQSAEDSLSKVFSYEGSGRIRIDASNSGYNDSFGAPQQCIDRMAEQAWSYIVERLEMRRVMSIERYKQLQEELRSGKLPPITEANVYAFCERYATDLPTLLREAVCETFEWLRPRHSKLKTNTQMEVGERVILHYVVEMGWTKGYRVNYNYSQNLVALENVFNSLDGNGQTCKGYASLLQAAIESEPSGCGETELFEFRACKNRNLHLRFKRLDLLKQFNMMAGGKRLRPGEAA
jgi:hypothetical protein